MTRLKAVFCVCSFVFSFLSIYESPAYGVKEEDLSPLESIPFQQFKSVDIRVGTIEKAEWNAETLKKGRIPAYRLEINFGPEVGVLVSSSQLPKRESYSIESLVGHQVIAVVNIPPRLVYGVNSQANVLGGYDEHGLPTLFVPHHPMPNGTRAQ